MVGGSSGSDAFDDAYALHMDALRWRRLQLRTRGGAALSRRIMFGHAALDGTLYLHGGADPTNLAALYSDLLALDLEDEMLVTVPTAGVGPPSSGLARHAMAATEGSLWVVGGWQGSAWLPDAFRLDLGPFLARGEPAVWRRIQGDGFTPWARAHSCLVAAPLPRPQLLLYGGGDADQDFDDAYALDTTTHYWERLSDVDGPRMALSQAACALIAMPAALRSREEGSVLQNATMQTLAPVPAHLASSKDGSGATRSTSFSLAVHGGYGGAIGTPSRHDALRLLHWGRDDGRVTRRWTVPHVSGSAPVARMGHCLHVLNSSSLVLFGGSADDRRLNDVLIGTPNRIWHRQRRGDPAAAAGTPHGVIGTEAAPAHRSVHDAPDSLDHAIPDEEIVVRTVRTADLQKAKQQGATASLRGRGKTRRRRRGGRTSRTTETRQKDEL